MQNREDYFSFKKENRQKKAVAGSAKPGRSSTLEAGIREDAEALNTGPTIMSTDSNPSAGRDKIIESRNGTEIEGGATSIKGVDKGATEVALLGTTNPAGGRRMLLGAASGGHFEGIDPAHFHAYGIVQDREFLHGVRRIDRLSNRRNSHATSTGNGRFPSRPRAASMNESRPKDYFNLPGMFPEFEQPTPLFASMAVAFAEATTTETLDDDLKALALHSRDSDSASSSPGSIIATPEADQLFAASVKQRDMKAQFLKAQREKPFELNNLSGYRRHQEDKDTDGPGPGLTT